MTKDSAILEDGVSAPSDTTMEAEPTLCVPRHPLSSSFEECCKARELPVRDSCNSVSCVEDKTAREMNREDEDDSTSAPNAMEVTRPTSESGKRVFRREKQSYEDKIGSSMAYLPPRRREAMTSRLHSTETAGTCASVESIA